MVVTWASEGLLLLFPNLGFPYTSWKLPLVFSLGEWHQDLPCPSQSPGLNLLETLKVLFCLFIHFTLFSGPSPLGPGLAGPTKPKRPAQHSHPTPRKTARAAPRTLQPLNLTQLLPPFGATYPLWLVSRDFLLLRRSWGRCPHECSYGLPCPCRGWDPGLHQCWFPQPPLPAPWVPSWPHRHSQMPAPLMGQQSSFTLCFWTWESALLKNQARKEHEEKCGFES